MGSTGLMAAFLPVAGLIRFAGSGPKLWGRLVRPFVLGMVVLTAATAVLMMITLPLFWAAPLLIGGYLLACVVLFEAISFCTSMQEFIIQTALEDIGVLEILRAEYGRDTLPVLARREKYKHKVSFLIARCALMGATLLFAAAPGIGQLFVVLLNGWLYAWHLVDKQLVLIGLNKFDQQFGHVIRNFLTYVAYGTIALSLLMVPGINIFFFAGNAYGGALLFKEFVDAETPEQRSLRERFTS
mmetsp:Transcript_91589/g.258976  ORF Transcript_91589/g.258976 Transcript_91589/m.258976 type:complete len:242 (-) Transcript_91589:147-872(-)